MRQPSASEDDKMHVAIHLSNHLVAEAIYQLLISNGYSDVVVLGASPPGGPNPHVLLVDSTTLRQDLLARHPTAKILLIDMGLEPEQLCITLLSYRVHGVISSHAELDRFRKALKAVGSGQVWIDNEALRVLLEETGAISRKGKISGVTDREKEIIAHVCQGLTNREVARILGLSEHTVKRHLNNIFKKFNVTTRSRLITLAMKEPRARSA